MKKRLSTSFSDEEIILLNALFNALARGGDTSVLRRNKAFPALCAKINKMHRRLEVHDE